MLSFFVILLKINIVLAIFVISYYIILRKLTFYTWNRIFLLTGIVFSTLYPFLDLSFFSDKSEHIPFVSAAPGIRHQLRHLVTNHADPVYYPWLFAAFYTGFSLMCIRLLRQFVSLYRVHRGSNRAFVGEIPVRLISEEVSPFTFGRNIYVNFSFIKKETLQTIIAHEHVHVRHWHTFDILLTELALSICWFNPAVWMIRKAVKENLEFIADRQVLKAGADKRSYQLNLLKLGTVGTGLTIANDFNLVELKRRIHMMNRTRSSNLMLGRYLLLIPVIGFVSLAFTMSPKRSDNNAAILPPGPYNGAPQSEPDSNRALKRNSDPAPELLSENVNKTKGRKMAARDKPAAARIVRPVEADKPDMRSGLEQKIVVGKQLQNTGSDPETKSETAGKSPWPASDLEPRTVIGRPRQTATDSSTTKTGN
jgi:hypothetical protein